MQKDNITDKIHSPIILSADRQEAETKKETSKFPWLVQDPKHSFDNLD